MSEGLSSLGHSVTVLTTSDNNVTESELINGIKIVRLRRNNLYFLKWRNKPSKFKRLFWHLIDFYNISANKEIGRIINTIKPEVAICHNITGFSISIWDCLRSHRVPIIQVLHDQHLLCPSNCYSIKRGKACEKQCKKCRLFGSLKKMKSSNVDVVVGVSRFVLQRICNNGYFKRSNKVVIRNAQELPGIEKESYWDGKRPLIVGYIGTIAKNKGVEDLINAFKALSINAELSLAGKGSHQYEEYVKEMASSDNRIKFLGYTKSTDFYNKIDICVLPSVWFDTFPGVAYESCAHSVPVVASNIGGIPEIIHHGKNGLLFEAGNIESLKDAILELYNSPRKLSEYSRKARSEVEEMLDARGWINKYNELVNNLCSP